MSSSTHEHGHKGGHGHAPAHTMTPEQRTRARRAVVAASLGNALEWYDWSSYATFSIYCAREIFNPQATALQASLLANVVLIIPCRCGASSPTSGAGVRR